MTKWHKGGCDSPRSVSYYIHTTQPNQMRKIEAQMIDAIHDMRDFTSGNTKVVTEGDTSVVYLHGHKIAEVDENSIRLFDGGWQTNTTKSRLNAILSSCGFAGECVVQKDFNWFYRKFVGAMNGQSVFILKDFESGMFA